MNMKKIWLSSPHMGGKEIDFVQEAFDTNWVAPLGANVDGFEHDIENVLGEGKSVVALTTGTASIHIGLILLGVKAGDEVICQSFTFSASANPIVYQGATPIFIDSEKDTWNMCPECLEIAIKDRMKKGKKPKAIIPVHLYGMPSNMDAISAIAEKYEIPILEDAAEALGSIYKGKHCGTMGEFAALSFNGNKIITTSGGGALICSTKAVADKVKFLITQARDNAPHYQHSNIGYNYRMSNISAGIGRGQMLVLKNRVEKRRLNNELYRKELGSIDGISFQTEPSNDYYSNYWLTTIVIDPASVKAKNRTDLYEYLSKEYIEARPLWKPMHLQPIFKDAPYYGNGVSDDFFDKGLCLPSGSNLEENDIFAVIKAIQRLIEN